MCSPARSCSPGATFLSVVTATWLHRYVSSLPEISVLMPVRNGARFLQQAVESVLLQTHADFELLAVDDGSTDNSVDILASIDDPRILLHSNPGSGIADALNFALAQARGPLVARMDADDISRADRFERQSRALRESGAGLMGSWYAVIDELGRDIGTVPTAWTDRQLRLDLFVRCPLGHGTVMAQRAVMLDVGGYRPAQSPAEDYDMWARLASRTTLACLPEVLYEYRVHGCNTTNRNDALSLQACQVRDFVWLSSPPKGGLACLAEVHQRSSELTDYSCRLSLRTLSLGELRFVVQAIRRRRLLTAAREAPFACALAGLWLLSILRRHD